MTADLDGKRAFVMTMRAREQDIRREKAASNICTNQALLALAASIYLSTIGPHGLRDVAATGAARAAELEAALAAAGAPRLHEAPYLNELVVRVPDARAVHARLLERGILAGIPTADLLPDEPSLADGLLVCATEVTTSDEIERFAAAAGRRARRGGCPGRCGVSVVGERLQPTIFERSAPGRGGGKIPHPPPDALDRIPAAALRATPAALPELAEPEVVRHYVNLSQLNYSVDTGFYPLGSCTMKYNPKLNEWAARLPGFANLHPMAPDATAQGTLAAPLGARGDAGRDQRHGRGHAPAGGGRPRRADRDPDDPRLPPVARRHRRGTRSSSRTPVHGTNPATATMAGFRTITIPSAPDGGVDIDAFRAALGPKTAAIMITNPSTLGLFERRIGELLEATHAAGALAYMDGANLNAILGRFRPGEAGFDVMHFNTHKTFSTPHGGGGPGAGPVGVRAVLVPFLPAPRVIREAGRHVPPRADGRAPDLHRPGALVLRQHGRPRARVRVHPCPRRYRPARGVRRRRPGRELPQGPAPRHATRSRSTGPASTSSSRPPRTSSTAPASGPWTSPSA